MGARSGTADWGRGATRAVDLCHLVESPFSRRDCRRVIRGSVLLAGVGEDASVDLERLKAELLARRARRRDPYLLTETDIASLEDTELDDRVWARLLSLVDPGDPEALMVLPPGVRAYLATRLFEWEVGNGGLHQYFFNYPSPDLLTLVLDGYSCLGLPDARRVVEELVAPVAEAESAWRESLRDGTIEGFFASYPESRLPSYDDRIGYHDDVRVGYLRAHPELFAS